MLYVFEGSQGGWYVVDDIPGPNGFRRFVSERFTDRDDAERRALRLSVESGVGVSTSEDCLGVHVDGTEEMAMATVGRYSTFGYLASDGATVYAYYHSNPDGSVSWDHPADARDGCKVCAATPARGTAGMIVDQRAVDRARGLARDIRRKTETGDTGQDRESYTDAQDRKSYTVDESANAEDAAKHDLEDAMLASIAEESEEDAARIAMLDALADASLRETTPQDDDEDAAEDNRGGSDDDDVEQR